MLRQQHAACGVISSCSRVVWVGLKCGGSELCLEVAGTVGDLRFVTRLCWDSRQQQAVTNMEMCKE